MPKGNAAQTPTLLFTLIKSLKLSETDCPEEKQFVFNAARSAHTNVIFCFSSVFAKCCKLFLLLHECDITFYVPKRYDVVLGPSDFLGMWC